MRLATFLLLAVIAAGCSHHGGGKTAVVQPPRSFKPSPVVHKLSDQEAADGALSARGFWRRDLRAAARKYPGIRFRSPSRAVFLARLRHQARSHDFQVAAFRMIRPRQLAPLVVVTTSRPLELSNATGSIIEQLDPERSFDRDYEGVYFEARDRRGVPLFAVSNVVRGRLEGGQWARSEALYPFPHG
jgi:hypothetical protein